MACNTLLNATEHFKKLNLLGELRSVSPEDYNTVEQEIKNLEKLFKEKYGIVDSFFNLKMVQTPTIARDGKFTNFRLDFNPQAFKKLDIAVINYNAAYISNYVKPGVQELFNENPELSSIGTEQQYSNYLDTIFPDSQVKDIVYHGGYASKESGFSKDKTGGSRKAGSAFYFASKQSALGYMGIMGDAPNLLSVILDIKNPYKLFKNNKTDISFRDYGKEKIRKESVNNDSIVYIDNSYRQAIKEPDAPREVLPDDNDEYVVFEPEQIHILGSKQDVEGFKKFVAKQRIKTDLQFKTDKKGIIKLVHYSSKNTNPLDDFQEDYPLYTSKGENSEYQDYGKKFNFLIKENANIKSLLDFHGKYGIDLDKHDQRSNGIQPYHFSLQEIQAIRKEGVDILIDDWGEYIILNKNSVILDDKQRANVSAKPGEQLLLFKPSDAQAHIDNVYKGDLYPSQQHKQAAIEQDNQDMAFMPVMTGVPLTNGFATNITNAISFKETLLKNINKRLGMAQVKRKTDKSPEVKKEIAKLNDLKTKVEKDINDLKDDPNLVDKMFSIFNKDIAIVSHLLNTGTPSIDNIHYAEDILSYFEVITDYSSDNRDNHLVDVSDIKNIDPEVIKSLDKLKAFVTAQKTALHKAKESYLLKAIDKSEKLKTLFPDSQLEEIKEILLSPQKDISLISLLFGTVEEDFSGNETLLSSIIRDRLEKTRNKTKTEASTLIQKINALQDNVKAKLIEMGYGLSIKGLNSLISEVNYDLFYQKTSQGNKTGRLVSKFSQKWYQDVMSFMSSNGAIFRDAVNNRDGEAANTSLLHKYTWLNEKTDLIELGKLPEIISNTEFASFSSYFNIAEAQNYKKELIGKIGQYEYTKLVEHQTELLEDYMAAIKEELTQLLDKERVTTPADLSYEAINHFNIFAKRRNPFDLIVSHKAGQMGRVDYVAGNASSQYQSHIRYNTYIPKRQLDIVDMDGMPMTMESEYYDKDFDKIEAEPTLLEFWEVLSDATGMMNSTLSDTNVSLGHYSLLRMGQSTTDILLNKETSLLNKTTHLLKETGQSLKGLLSTKDRKVDVDSVPEVNKSQIKTIQDEVNKRYEVVLMRLSTANNMVFRKKTLIELKTVNQETKEILESITGKNIPSLISTYGERMSPYVLKEYLTNQVMEEQTFNLPLMMRAYLDMVSEYKAQKDALPEISIFKGLYDEIQVAKQDSKVGQNLPSIRQIIDRKTRKAGIEDKRWMSQLRMKTWINKNVKGISEPEVWGRLGMKNLNSKEKEFKKDAEEYLKLLKAELENTDSPEEQANLASEITEVEYALENLGEVVALSAMYENLINRLPIFVGLGYNIKTQIVNRFQGWWQGMINDTGRYWPKGAFYAANAFINRKGARRLPGMSSYRNEINKTKLLVEKLNVLQDATNEIDRAKRDSGIRGKMKVLDPFYLVEYVEWHNQVPQILSMLSGMTIKDKQGKEYPIFDGNGLPAYTIVNGQLVLKPEFDTPSNRETWVDFSDDVSSDNKSRITKTIAILNGDYSKTGTTFVKKSAVGRTLMMFKTWLPKQIRMRYGSNQTDLDLGQGSYDGAYTGALKTNKSRTGASALIGAEVALLSTMTLGLGFGGVMAGGLLVNTIYKNRKASKDGENLETMKQLGLAGQALVKKFIGLPINTVSGKNLIKSQDFSSLGLTKAEEENFHFIVNETVGLLYLTLVKVAIKAMFGDDEEDEPKTINGQPNPYYFKKRQSEEEKSFGIIMENQITRLISDVSLYMSPEGLYTITMNPAGIDSWFKNVVKISDGLSRKVQGNDELETGPNQGKSKFWVSTRETLLPGIFNEWIDGDFDSFGYKKQSKKDFNPGELQDYWFKSDYAKDRKTIKAERATAKEELQEYWEKEFKYEELSADDKIVIDPIMDKLIKEELNATHPLDIRGNYDENQERIE